MLVLVLEYCGLAAEGTRVLVSVLGTIIIIIIIIMVLIAFQVVTFLFS